MFPFLTLGLSRNVARTRQHDNLSFSAVCICKQFVVGDDGGHDGQLGSGSDAGLIRAKVSAYIAPAGPTA